mgnify:CR=1 FL=1
MKSEKSGASAIFRSLLEEISEGRLVPGDSLESEQALMERFNVSRSMIRDAVAMLAGIGAIDRARGRTGVIQKVDSSTISHMFPLILSLSGRESLKEVYELRILIESETAAKAAIRANDETLREILKISETYDEIARTRTEEQEESEKGDYIDTDVKLHIAIARASGNSMYVTLLEILTGFLRYVQFETCRGNLVRSREAAHEHSRIAQALVCRDPDASRVEMSHHLRVSQEALKRTMREDRLI